MIFWSNGIPWREANLWSHERATTRDVSVRTVESNALSLSAYAKWLEDTKTDWWDFPQRKADRCLVRYRGALIEARDAGKLAPSTISQRMRVLISFYRWLQSTGIISTAWPLWKDRTIGIRLTDTVGFERTMLVTTTDLSIPNRAAPGSRLEDGLLPLAPATRDLCLGLAHANASEEFFLMLTLGFFTGMRIGTIADLKVKTLMDAVPDPASPDLYKIAVGPGAAPPVATKFGVTGTIWIARVHVERLLEYAHSVRRLERESRAKPEHKDLVFLTRFGNPYARHGSEKSSSINVEIHAFRKLALRQGLTEMRTFRFHQTRCTYATELAKTAIRFSGSVSAIAIVKQALLHKHEETSLRYIKFVEKAPIKQDVADAFTRAFLGILSSKAVNANV